MFLPTPTRILTLVSTCLLLWMIYRVHDVSSRDPTSTFFNPRYGYKPRYSAIRRQQAERFIDSANVTGYTAPELEDGNGQKKRLCVGIPSMASRGPKYLEDTVGSLLDGLMPSERAEVYFTVFIPHTDPTTHPAYASAWLPGLADKVLTYDVPADELTHIQGLEKEGGEYREKGLYDYRYLLRHCAEQHTPYIAIFEDDIVAMEGWYRRAMKAVEDAERMSAEQYASTEFLYLRLFYTEEFLGWNKEDWKGYLLQSLVVFTVPMSVLYALRTRDSTASRHLTPRILLSISISLTILIATFFALGRTTVAPLPHGVSLMPQFGCCSQALLFPRSRALLLAHYLKESGTGPVDVLIEDFANEKGELRWAVSPALVQHVGRKSSKVDDFGEMSKYGMSVAEKIWSFGFEGWDWERLRMERERLSLNETGSIN